MKEETTSKYSNCLGPAPDNILQAKRLIEDTIR